MPLQELPAVGIAGHEAEQESDSEDMPKVRPLWGGAKHDQH